VSHELFYGNDAKDLSYEAAYAEAKAEAEHKYAGLVEEASIAASEAGADREGDFDAEAWEEKWFDLYGHEHDPEIFVERELEQFSDMCQIEEPTIEGKLDGVKYHISWLGGAPILFVFEGPLGCAENLCSPCVPGAADLDSGFTLDTEFEEDYVPDTGYSCYCVPREWIDKEPT
jgi:hypothetical protein